MESVLGRYRNLIILVGVLFLQVLGLAVQVKRSADAESTRLIRIWAVDLITPFERSFVWIKSESGDLWHNYFYLRGVRAENRELKQQIEDMRLKDVRLSEDATQAHRLQSLLAFKEQFIEKTVAAQVIGSCASDRSRCIYIDKGTNDGIAPEMAVITATGIVGKVLSVYPSTSQVLMINDQSSGAGALLEKSRLQGVLRGTPNGELLLERVMSDETVAPGEAVLTSGGEQIFPKGLPVGTVIGVSPGKEMFLRIRVKPAADLNRLEEVLVVTQKQERQAPVADNGGRVRAADILAQRLPSVPDKPAVADKPGAAAAAPAASSTVNSPATVGSIVKTQPKPNGNAAAGVANGNAANTNAASGNGTKVVTNTSPASASASSTSVGNTDGTGTPHRTDNAAAPENPGGTPVATNPSVKPATPRPTPANPPVNPPANPQPAADDPH